MQIYALDALQQLICADHAVKQTDYSCPECGGVVRVRRGTCRQPHFYHLLPSSSCYQSGKSLTHLEVQKYFLRQLPEQEVVLERRFPEINRIADVVWVPKKIVFEIQCSAITVEEIMSRNRDYTLQGYTVVWILHTKRFNKHRITSAERVLMGLPCYFTDMDEEGFGAIYDRFSLMHKDGRRSFQELLPIQISSLQVVPDEHLFKNGPKLLKRRIEAWSGYFSGDVIHRCLESTSYRESIVQFEAAHTPSSPKMGLKHYVQRYFVRPYFIALQFLLEKASR